MLTKFAYPAPGDAPSDAADEKSCCLVSTVEMNDDCNSFSRSFSTVVFYCSFRGIKTAD